MQEQRPRNLNSALKSRRTGGYVFVTLGVVIIVINMFIIVKFKGHVMALSKALLPLGCILIAAGICFCCIKDTKTRNPWPSQYNGSSNLVPRYNASSDPIPQHNDSSVFVHTHQAVLHQNSVPENDDFPPRYEDCVALDINNYHVPTVPSVCTSKTTNGDSGCVVSNGGDSGNSTSCAVNSGGICDSGAGGTDSGGGSSSTCDSGCGGTDSGGGSSSTCDSGGGGTDSGGGCNSED